MIAAITGMYDYITTKGKPMCDNRIVLPRLSQAGVQAKYGVEKSFLRSLLNNQFYIPECFHECLAHYRLSIVSSVEFRTRIKEGTLVQTVAGKQVEFAVIYSHCSPASIKSARTVRLSFRAAQPEIGLEPVVIAQIGDTGTSSNGGGK